MSFNWLAQDYGIRDIWRNHATRSSVTPRISTVLTLPMFLTKSGGAGANKGTAIDVNATYYVLRTPEPNSMSATKSAR